MTARIAVLPLDYYMAVGGDIRVWNGTRWVVLVLHDDGSVTWEARPGDPQPAAEPQ